MIAIIIQSILSNLAIIILLHLFVEKLMNKRDKWPKLAISAGMVALVSVSVILLFYLPITFHGFWVDLRMIPLLFLTIRWGYKLAIPALMITAFWRFLMGGVGMVPGIIFGMALPVLFALMVRYVCKEKFRPENSKSLFFLITCGWLISDVPIIFFVPNGLDVFLHIFPYRYGSFLFAGYTLNFFIRHAIKEDLLKKQLQYYAERDPLTGFYNIRTFLKKIEGKNPKYHYSYIVMADIDHFKQINDTYGHLNGDEILKKLSSIFREVKAHFHEAEIIIGRYGGEEFIFYIAAGSRRHISSIVSHFREEVEKTYFFIKESKCAKVKRSKIRLTISLGVSPINDPSRLMEAIDRADQCLYKSKENGRNQVHFADG